MRYAELEKLKRIKWYRSPIENNQLRRYTRRSNVRGSFQAIGHLALLIATGTIAFYFLNQRHWLPLALVLFAHGTIASLISSGVHELAHGTVFQSKWLNRTFLWVYGVLDWANIRVGLLSHTYHHLYTLHQESDGEVRLPQNPTLKALDLLQLFTLNLAVKSIMAPGLIPMVKSHIKTAFGKPLASREDQEDDWLTVIYRSHPEDRAKSIKFARIVLLFHISVIVIAIITQLWLLPVLITFARWIGNWWRFIIYMPMHCGLKDNVADFRKCTRSIRLDPLSTFLYWRMNWHIEHHMFAAVPCYNLKNLHDAIAVDQPEVRSLFGAWREMRVIWRQQKEDPSYQFDTPVPIPRV